MKTTPSDKTLVIPQPVTRKRIQSLRSYNEFYAVVSDPLEERAIFKTLQKCLQNDNSKQVQLIAEPQAIIPGYQEIKVQNKLWKYFVTRVGIVSHKVEIERVNACERQLFSLKKQVQKRKELYQKNLMQLQRQIKDHYREIHHHFEQIKNQRIIQVVTCSSLKNKKSKKSQDNIIPDNNEKIVSIKEVIESLRKEISKQERQLANSQNQLAKIEAQWLSFLKRLLKQGFYLKNGVISIFNEMILLNYTLSDRDLPDILDETSKKCLLLEFDRMKTFTTFDKSRISSKSYSDIVPESKKGIRQIVQKDRLFHIYNGTKNYVIDWIKKEGWKEVILPKIKYATQRVERDWRVDQRKRIVHLYQDRETYNIARGILFGPKVETNQ